MTETTRLTAEERETLHGGVGTTSTNAVEAILTAKRASRRGSTSATPTVLPWLPPTRRRSG